MNFFKAFLASCLGIFTSAVLLFLLFFIIIVSSSSQPQPVVPDNAVLTIELSGDIPARIIPDPIAELFNPNAGAGVSLVSLKENLEKANADDDIQGVWVKANMLTASWANLETAYSYFQKYKDGGKFLYFSTDDIGMNEKTYYLATLADSIFSPPSTNFEFDGFIASMTFYNDMLNKIGIEPQVFRVGKYKSAVEPYTQTSPSQESREQMYELLEASASTFVEAVSERTGKSADEVNSMLNSAPVNRLNFALENGLIDAFAFEDDVEAMIKKRIGLEEDDDLKTIEFKKYSKISPYSAGVEMPDTYDKIAVIYTSGTIIPDLGDSPFAINNAITAENVQEQLDKALKNKNVKGIVIHIDSPGGAATTSDLIWNSIRKAGDKKPVVISMGSVAASGGYYIAMGADTVVAGKNTITGSIGIFNLLMNARELLEDKIGLDFTDLKTHEYADLLNLTEPFTPAEQRIIQQNVENGYEIFLNRVAESRGWTRDEVHELAQGRVYTGEAALEAGLVDELGGIERAIEIAAELAEIDAYTLENYPKQKSLLELLYGNSAAKIKSIAYSWIPQSIQQDVNDLSLILKHPNAQNWAILPVRYDVN